MKLVDKIRTHVADVRTIATLCTGAEAEARRDGQSLPGAEHLLLSALALPDGSARRSFERVGAEPDGLRTAIATQHTDALRALGIEPPAQEALDQTGVDVTTPGAGAFRATATFDRAFRAAGQLARSTTSAFLGAHVVVAVAQMEHGTAPRALRAMGIDLVALATAALAEIGD